MAAMQTHLAPLRTFYNHSSIQYESTESTHSLLRGISPSLESLLEALEASRARRTSTGKPSLQGDALAFAATKTLDSEPRRSRCDRSSSDVSDFEEAERQEDWRTHRVNGSYSSLRIPQPCSISTSRASQHRHIKGHMLYDQSRPENPFQHQWPVASPAPSPPKSIVPSLKDTINEQLSQQSDHGRHQSFELADLRIPDNAMLTPSRPAPKPPIRKHKPTASDVDFMVFTTVVSAPAPLADEVPRLYSKDAISARRSPAPSYKSHQRLYSKSSTISNRTTSSLAYSQAQTCVEPDVARRNPSIVSLNTVFSTPGRDELERKQGQLDKFTGDDGPFGKVDGMEELMRRRREVSGELGEGQVQGVHTSRSGWWQWLGCGCLGRSK